MSDESLFDFDETSEIEFGEKYGLTFAFKKKTIHLNKMISSCEIYPLGIIYKENDECYFAPLYQVDNIDEIIEEYVKKYFQK